MLKAIILSAIVASVALVGLAFVSSVTKRFVYSVTLDVDGQHVSGATVWEQRTDKPLNPLGNAPPLRSTVRGQAIALPVNENTVVFALKRSVQGSNPNFGAFLLDCGLTSIEAIRAFTGGCSLPATVLLVARGNLHGEEVPTLEIVRNDMAAGVKLAIVSSQISVTDEPITTGLLKQYPWIAQLETGKIKGPSGSTGYLLDPAKILQIDFVSE